jgi:hypothetical protein
MWIPISAVVVAVIFSTSLASGSKPEETASAKDAKII